MIGLLYTKTRNALSAVTRINNQLVKYVPRSFPRIGKSPSYLSIIAPEVSARILLSIRGSFPPFDPRAYGFLILPRRFVARHRLRAFITAITQRRACASLKSR